MSDAAPSKSGFWLTFVAAIGGFAIFVVILLVTYLPKQPEPLGDGAPKRSPEERKAALAELRAHEVKVAISYGWVDQPNGIVQLPIDRAVELTLGELSAKK